MTEEDFDSWNALKKSVHFKQRRLIFHEREIWFTYVGVNIGHEENGSGEKSLRPVLIYKKFNKRLFWSIPLTTNIHDSKYYFNFLVREKENSAILSQLKIMDVKRLCYQIDIINKEQFNVLNKKLQRLLPEVF